MKEDQSHLPGKTSGEWWLYKGHLYNDLSLGSIKEILIQSSMDYEKKIKTVMVNNYACFWILCYIVLWKKM